MTNPVTTSDLESRWRSLSTDEATVAESLLDDAWAQLQTLAPAVVGLVPGSLAEDVARGVICAAVLRVMRNPDGNRSESIDDYSWTRDVSTATGGLYFSDVELALVNGGRSRAKSVTFANDTWWSW